MIDIHAHILPGIDDGATDIYDTLEMAALAASQGVKKIVATPHSNLPGFYDNYFGVEYKNAYIKAVQAIRSERIEIELLPGMEAFATADLPQLIVDKKIMPINQTRYILIEFGFDEEPEFADYVLKNVKEIGARPIIAHAERYEFIQDYPEIIENWRREGYAIQVNKSSFKGSFGRRAEEAANRMLRRKQISVIASDAHGVARRTPGLAEVYELLDGKCSEAELENMLKKNPLKICEGLPLYV